MARIGIEDQFFIDAAQVGARIGDYQKAVGMALLFIQFGQLKYKTGQEISYAEFFEKFSDALIPEFAKRDGDTITVVGANKHFAWLRSKVEAGKIGGRSKSPKKTKTLKQNRNTSNHSRSTAEAKPNTSEPSPSPSYSLTGSRTFTDSVPSERTKAGAFIVGYKNGILKKYGFSPNVQGKDAGIAARIANRLSYEEIETYLDAFFQMPDAELVKKKHPVFLFEIKLNEIAAFAHTGAFTSQREANQADDSLALATQLKNIREGRL